ncbi:MAG: PAS domain S-box protein [Candidatus Acidiferrum sp.]
MLPSGKFPRLAVVAALLLALLLVFDLEFVRSATTRLLISNSLDLAMALLAAACSFYAARRSSAYARQLWFLLAIAFALEALAQAISSYYQSFVPGAAQTPWPSDVLFFVWPAPVFMMFLPRSDEDSAGIAWLRILDFIQVAIVAVTAYLYFFYSSARWQAAQPALLRQILILYIARDLILSLAFFFRSRASLPSWLRSFSLVLGLVFLTAVLSDADYLFTLGTSVGAATWGDFLWMLPLFIVILLAVTWKQPGPAAVSSSPSAGQLVAAQILPIAIPLLVIFMGRAIAPELLPLAWLAVTASVVCSSARLMLTNRRQRRISDQLLDTEKALRSSERIFASAFRSSPDSMSINVFPDGPYLDVNDGFTRLTGYSREEVLHKTASEMNLWEDPPRRAELFQQLVQTGELRENEFRYRTKSGQIRTGLMSGALLDLDARRCCLVVVRDITERKAAEELLRSSEERFRSLVENLHVGIIIYDPHVRVLFANQAVQDAFGRQYEQFLGKTTDELGLFTLREDGTELRAEARPVPIVLATKQPVRGQVIGVRRRDSTGVTWTLLDAIPEFNAAGEISRIIVSVTDLTEQRKALDALRESEERFRTLVRDLHVAVVLNDPQGKIEFANQAALKMLGITDFATIGGDVASTGMIPVDEQGRDMPLADRPVATVLRTRRPVHSRTMGWRRSGSPEILWIFGNSVPQFNPDGSILRVISTFTDISEMKNAEQAIRQLSMQLLKLQDEERRRIGRELHDGMAQTVLAVNLSLAQVRQSSPSLSEPAARALEKARALLQQMSREIRTLSYLLHPPLLDELGLVSALKEYVRGFSERSGIETELVFPKQFSRLPQFVEIALFRVVQESLANIQRHSGSDSATIRLREDPPEVTLEITDYGCGMKLASNGPSQPDLARFGVGIPGMRERMAQLGGRLAIESGPSGTTVRATISSPEGISKEPFDGPASHPDRG